MNTMSSICFPSWQPTHLTTVFVSSSQLLLNLPAGSSQDVFSPIMYVCIACLWVACPAVLHVGFLNIRICSQKSYLYNRCERRVSGTCVAASWLQIPEIMFEVVIISSDKFIPDFVNIGQLFQTLTGGGIGSCNSKCKWKGNIVFLPAVKTF